MVWTYRRPAILNLRLQTLKNQLIFNLDARATLVSVESGNVPIGIVYSSDALLSDLVKIIFHVESTSIVVEYPVAVIGEKAHYQKTNSFLEYLTSDESSEVFSKFGFKFLEWETMIFSITEINIIDVNAE